MNENPPRWFQHEHHEVKQKTPTFSAPMLVAEGDQLVIKQKV